MKAKIAIMTVIGFVACNAAMAQTDSPDAKPAPADVKPATTDAQDAKPATPDQPDNKPAAPDAKPATDTPDTKPATPAAPTTPAASVDKNPIAPTSPDAVIPLIQFQGVPLTTAIENLARQANLNYILDPKLGYGQPDERGVVKPDPNISVRWENVTAQQALLGLLSTYDLQIVDDPKTHISRITKKDPAALDPLQTQVLQLKFQSASNMLTAIQGSLTDKRSKVLPDNRTSQLVVVATEKELTSVSNLVTRLDLPPKQVLIEAKLIESSINPKTSKGVDWSSTFGDSRLGMGRGQNIRFGNTSTYLLQPTAPTITPDPVGGGVVVTPGYAGLPSGVVGDPGAILSSLNGWNPGTAFLNADGLTAVLSFLNQSADAKVIATPRAVTLDNETADLSVSRAFPIFKNTAGTQGSPGGSEVAYTNVGTFLRVTPRISANNFVNLRVTPEVSSVFTTIRKTVASTVNEADVFDIRKIDTQVLIPSGNTLVLGGLVRDQTNKGSTKIPLLGDIPGLGYLFRNDTKSRDQANLTIFITPTIVQDSDFQPTKTDFLQTKGEEIDNKKWSAWDSGEPYDWSK